MPAASASSTSQVRSSSVSKVRQVPIPMAGTSIPVVPSWRRSTRQTYTLACRWPPSRPLRTTNPLEAWRVVMSTCNAPAGANDVVTRWLVLTRACVQPMTLTSAAIAGLLAVRAPGFNPWLFGLAAFGIVLAHAGNNLVNDIFDESLGADTADYPRALYAPHPVLSGMATRRTLVIAFLVLNALDLLILVTLTAFRGWPVIAFALLGLLGSVGYAAPCAPLQEAGPGRAGGLPGLGPADGRRHLLRGHRPPALAGGGGLDPLLDPLHDRPLRQAHRQAAVGRAA